MPSTLSIICPVYNEQDNVHPFYDELTRVLAAELADFAVEIICVNDGSRDDSLPRLRALAAADPRVKIISFSRNFGHQAALTAGLERATGDAIITMDSDMQDPPALLPKLVEQWRAGNQIVYARRASRVDTAFKRVTADLYYRIMSGVAEVDMPRQVGDFRLIDRIVLKNLLRLGEHARYLRGMVAWLGFRHTCVDFARPDRLHGETHYPLRKMLKLAMDGLLNFTFMPLKIGFWVGVASMLLSGAFLAYMVVDKLLHPHIEYPLFKWLTVVLLGFVGAQFIFLWILGEYIGRIYNDVRRRPLYVVAEELNFTPTPAAAER
jgi:polyisoprenyl-phosphate glycosyltransferase